MMRYTNNEHIWWHFILLFSFLFVTNHQLLLTKGAITGPKSTDTPIRLVNSKPEYSTNVNNEGVRNTASSTATAASTQPHTTNRHADNSNAQPHLQGGGAKVEISEPPDKSYIAGGNVFVRIKIEAKGNQEEFNRTYLIDDNGRVCFSLDLEPYHCWPLNKGVVFYSQAVEGSHTLSARLYRNGSMDENSASSTVTFTTVNDANIELYPNATFHNQTILMNDSTTSDKSNTTLEKTINVTFPAVQIISPADKVSYTGDNITFQSLLKPSNEEIFRNYFRYSFVCINIDMASAHSCFRIFDSDSNYTKIQTDEKRLPLVLNLDPGLHTIEASLSHPVTGDLLDQSSLGTHIFFMTGKFNEAAALTVKINIRGKSYSVPVAKGGDIIEQSKAVCYKAVGVDNGMNTCLESVSKHLLTVAQQSGLIFS